MTGRRYLFANLTGLLFFLLVWMSCTDNPFVDSVMLEPTRISGQVQLADGITPDSIFVWLEEFNFGTYTDSVGNFALTLPPPEVQGDGLGFSGTYQLYYYLSNYSTTMIPLEFSAGDLEPDQPQLDTKGRLFKIPVLEKILDVRTRFFCLSDSLKELLESGLLDPEYVEILNSHQNLQDTMKIDLAKPEWVYFYTLLKTYDRKLLVEALLLPQGVGIPATHIGLLFFPIEGDGTISIYDSAGTTGSFIHYFSLEKNEECRWEYYLSTQQLKIEPGRYHVVPYLKIINPELPLYLRQQVGQPLDMLGYMTRFLPMKRRDGVLIVTRSEESL
jgi:hypothetical protein